MKTVLRPRPATIPDATDPGEIQKWCAQENRSNKNLQTDLEDHLSHIGEIQSWTPVLSFATPGDLSVSYSVQAGDLIRTKEMIVASFNIQTSGFTWTTASGNLEITGLPYTGSLRSADSNFNWNGALVFEGITKSGYTQFNSQVRAGNNFFLVAASGSGKSAALVQAADLPTAGTVALIGSCAFRIKS